MNKVEISSIVKEKLKVSPGGLYCVFVKLDENWGIKLYKNEEYRDCAYNSQKEVLDGCRLAPEIGEKVNVGNRFGYITEIVDLVIPTEELDLYCGGGDDDHPLGEKSIYDIFPNVDCGMIYRKLESVGFDFDDDHLGNWGIKNGSPIPIDFY
jgi:hypothetical protein